MDRQWCWSADNENYSSGLFETRDAAIKDAVVELSYRVAEGEDVPSIYLGKANLAVNEAMFPDAEVILEHMYLQAEDIAGEWASDYPDFSSEAEAELTDALSSLLTEWCDKHKVVPTFYTVEEVETLDFDIVRKNHEENL